MRRYRPWLQMGLFRKRGVPPMNEHPEDPSPFVRPVWQRHDWRFIRGSPSPETQTEESNRAVQAYVHEVQQVVTALEEAKQSGSDVLLHCVAPQKVPHMLEGYGVEFLWEQRGDYAISGKVAFEAG